MKVGVLGCGHMGEDVIQHLLTLEEVDSVVAYDRSSEKIEATSAGLHVGAAYRLTEVLSDSEVKLVFVTASTDAHKELAMAGLAAGKAVMCEKAMATTLTDASAMAKAAGDVKGFLQIGFELRYSTLYTTVKDWIDQGLLGQILTTHCDYICHEFWGTRADWRLDRKRSGGMFGEKLSHYVDVPRWWTGGQVKDVYSASAANVVPYFGVRDNYQTTYRTEEGTICHIGFMMALASSSVGDPLQDEMSQQKDDGHELRYLIQGTRGAAETDTFGRSIKRWEFSENEGGLVSELVETVRWGHESDHEYFHNTRGQATDIVQRVAQGRGPSITPQDALETTTLCFAAEESTDTGQVVSLKDYKNRVFGS